MPNGSDIDDVWIRRVDHDAADVPRLLQADRFPRLSRIGRLVNAVAPRGALPVVRLTRADPDVACVRRRYGYVADRHHGVDAVEDRCPRRALVRAVGTSAAASRD